jgi:hypothetical protein
MNGKTNMGVKMANEAMKMAEKKNNLKKRIK